MSLRDYGVKRSNFEPRLEPGCKLPCSACRHLDVPYWREPCRTCDHNHNAVEENTPAREPTTLERIVRG